MAKQMDMIHGPLLPKILMVALPLAVTSILQQLFNSADVAVVGRFVGSSALAAVGSNGPIINIIINLFVGLSVGGNVVVATLLGQRKTSELKDAVHTVLTVALISGVVLVFFGIFFTRLILIWISTPEDVLPLATVYLRIFFLGMPFSMFYNFGSAVLRSKGDTKRPLVALVISGFVNVALNLFLVVVVKLGVADVAIATVVAQGISAGIVMVVLLREDGPLKFSFKNLCVRKKYLLWMMRIGIPSGVQGMVFSFSNICIQSSINTFGSSAMAGSAAALNYEYFTFFVTTAFSQTAVTFMSQNYGAHDFARCRRVALLCVLCSFAVTFAEAMTFSFFRHFFMSVYTDDPIALDFAERRTMCVEFFEYMPGIYEIPAGCMRALGVSVIPTVIIIVGSCLLRLCWIWGVVPTHHTWETLLYIYPITWVITIVLMGIAFAVFVRRRLR
ncbi:MAG: MATE family efflux transporter [Treponema sp.]|nr:MATE family efflux transporter [Treponema sp.]